MIQLQGKPSIFNQIVWISLGFTVVSGFWIIALKPREKITHENWKFANIWSEPTKPPAKFEPAPILPGPPIRIQEKPETYRQAIARAAKENKLVVVFFTLPSCTWCKKMKAEVFPDPTVKAALKKFIWVEVDIEADSKTADQWNVGALPTHLIVDGTEQKRKSQLGWMTAAQYVEWLR